MRTATGKISFIKCRTILRFSGIASVTGTLLSRIPLYEIGKTRLMEGSLAAVQEDHLPKKPPTSLPFSDQ